MAFTPYLFPSLVTLKARLYLIRRCKAMKLSILLSVCGLPFKNETQQCVHDILSNKVNHGV